MIINNTMFIDIRLVFNTQQFSTFFYFIFSLLCWFLILTSIFYSKPRSSRYLYCLIRYIFAFLHIIVKQSTLWKIHLKKKRKNYFKQSHMGNYEIKIKYNYICVVCVVTTYKSLYFSWHSIQRLYSNFPSRIVLITNMKSYNNNDI